MGIVLITGSHPRHAYLVRQLVATGRVSGWVREIRENFIKPPPDNLSDSIRRLYVEHFNKRESAEHSFFGSDTSAPIDTLDIQLEQLNGPATQSFLKKHSPELVISYGCHKLDVEKLAPPGTTFWNTHGGLSPEYRGVITHFWPSYFLEPQMTGMTLHETTQEIDGGAIVFQSAATMVAGDGLHELAGRTVKDYVDLLATKLAPLDLLKLPSGIKQKSSGRLFKAADWRPEHLDIIYNKYDDRIVDRVLSGDISGREPSLISAL